MSHQLKVGLIGVAGIARRHFPGWKESPHTELVALMREFTSVCEEWKANNSDYYRRFDDPGYPLERIAVTDSLRKKAESLGFEMNGVRRLDKMLSILLAGPSN